MPATTHVTIDMCLDELLRLQKVMRKSYPDQVKEGKLSPYTRDHRFAVMAAMVAMMQQAKAREQYQKNFLNKTIIT